MISINLLPAERQLERQRRQRVRSLRRLAGLQALWLVVLGGNFLVAHDVVRTAEARVTAAEVTRVTERAQEDVLQARARVLAQQAEAILALRPSEPTSARVYAALRVTPPGVEFDVVTLSTDSQGAAQMQITGSAATHRDVVALSEALRQRAEWSEIDIRRQRLRPDAAGGRVEFQLVATRGTEVDS